MLLESYTYEISLPPCNHGAQTVNAIAKLSNDISGVFPYLNAVVKGCIYDHDEKILMLKHEGKTITMYPRMIAITKLRDEEEAKGILEWLKDLINRTYERRSEIIPNYRRKSELKVMDIFKLLPRINCRECGEMTCLAFATKLLREEIEVQRCKPLFSDERYANNRDKLLKMMEEAGFTLGTRHTN